MPTEWKVARIQASTSHAELLEEWIATLQSIVPTGGAYEAVGADGAAEWRVIFNPDELPGDLEQVIGAIRSDEGVAQLRLLGVEDLPRENWHDAWRQYFQPVHLSDRVTIYPSWEKPERTAQSAESSSAPGQISIFVEPGMAFGTGTHATTQLCLRLLERLVAPGARILDAGAGSAILSIAAVKFGAGKVVAFEIDPDAEENARSNLDLNDVPTQVVELRIGGIEQAGTEQFDLIVCNMLSREFLPLLGAFRALVRETGMLLLSGLLTDEKAEIERAAGAAGFNIAESAAADEWSALVCKPA